MKKTSISILSILIIAILAALVFTPVYQMGKIFIAGIEAGYEQADAENAYNPDEMSQIDVAFIPQIETVLEGSDSIQFSNGEKYPVIMTRASILVPDNEWSGAKAWVTLAIYFVCLVIFVLFIIELVKFVVNINRGNIFVKKNVKRLNHVAIYLISLSILRILAGCLDDMMFNQLGLELDGYKLTTFWSFPWSSLLCGMLSLLIAQVWSRGIEMQEEQSLTI